MPLAGEIPEKMLSPHFYMSCLIATRHAAFSHEFGRYAANVSSSKGTLSHQRAKLPYFDHATASGLEARQQRVPQLVRRPIATSNYARDRKERFVVIRPRFELKCRHEACLL